MRNLQLNSYLIILLLCFSFVGAGHATSLVKVGVILDKETPIGKMGNTSVKLAVSDFYGAHSNYTTRIDLRFREYSAGDAVTAAAAALDLINEGAQVILGPQKSREAAFVAALGGKSHIPVVSFSATRPSLSPALCPYFVRAAPSDAAQVGAIAAIVQAFAWRRVVPIYSDDEYGTGILPALVDALDEVGAAVPYRLAIPPTTSGVDDLPAELLSLMTKQTRVFVVHMTLNLASRLFDIANANGMMAEGYVWILTSGLTSLLGSFSSSVRINSMQGVIGVAPYIPKSPEFIDFQRRWRREYLNLPEHSIADDVPESTTFAIWAYNAAWAVALAAEAARPTSSAPKLANGTTELSTLGISSTGEKLLGEILNTKFDGLGGGFRLVGGELNVSAFRIVNLNGEKARGIGFWTPADGLLRNLEQMGRQPYTAVKENLGTVIWPGDSTVVPVGWEEPMTDRTLRIAVPGMVEQGFSSFMSVNKDPATNATVATGFVFQVFEAAVRQLPYAIKFEYIPYVGPDGHSTGDYNQLVKQVALQKFDAVVADTTITSNRLLDADFTLPYTVSGVSMVVPLVDDNSQNAWIFLKPLTADLWIVSAAFFIFTGFVVWVLEHRINPEFRGPPAYQLGSVFYFTFSTLVFAHKESVVTNLARVVVIIWVFVVLVLTSSYTASLTSMLTVQQLRPAVTDMNDLMMSGDYVGHLQDSFVKKKLIKMGFDESKLRPYRSPQQFEEALSKGSKNGGIAAIIDELPYLKVFLKDYCQSYTMAGKTLDSGGFGFVFPKGSPLVPDLSRAILKITDGDEMSRIEVEFFGDQSQCPDNGGTISSNKSLDFVSFWGLFLITGSVSFLAFCCNVAGFFLKNRRDLADSSHGGSLVERAAKIFDQKDLSSHTFKKNEQQNGSNTGIRDDIGSPYPDHAQSRVSTSNHGSMGEAPLAELPSLVVEVQRQDEMTHDARQ